MGWAGIGGGQDDKGVAECLQKAKTKSHPSLPPSLWPSKIYGTAHGGHSRDKGHRSCSWQASSIRASGKHPWLINELSLKPQWQALKGLHCSECLLDRARGIFTLDANTASRQLSEAREGAFPTQPCPRAPALHPLSGCWTHMEHHCPSLTRVLHMLSVQPR